MAKSIRSKSKRKNRSEFRNTIGTDVAKANMAVVQAKLQECIGTGQLNSFDRLSALFSGGKPTGDGDVAMDGTAAGASGGAEGKDPAKVPAKKATAAKQKLSMAKSAGMYGDKTSKKVAERKHRRGRTATAHGGDGRGSRSRGRSLEGRRLRSSSKKR